MHIAMVTNGPVPAEGGLSTHIETLTLGLRDLGDQATVVSARERNDLSAKVARETGYYLHKYGRFTGRILRFMIEHRKQARQLSADLVSSCAVGHFDAINYHGVMAMLAATAGANDLGLPQVLTVHDYLAAGFVGVGVIRKGGAWERRFLEWERATFEAATEVVCVDTRLGRHVQSITHGRVNPHIIHNCVHPAFVDLGTQRKAYTGASPFVILCARRLTPKNGVMFAVEMARELSRRNVDFVLNLAGSGEERGMIEGAIERHQLESRVRMLGPIDRSQMMEEMRRSSAAIVPSVTHDGVEEATSISVMEGMAAGLPVIGSSIGGIAELITDGVNGFLVEQRSPVALADAVSALISDAELTARIGESAHRHAKGTFSHTVHAEKLRAVYQRCL